MLTKQITTKNKKTTKKQQQKRIRKLPTGFKVKTKFNGPVFPLYPPNRTYTVWFVTEMKKS